MGEAQFETECSFAKQTDSWLAIVVCKPDPAGVGLHAGLLHRRNGQATHVLHLAWDNDLRSDWKWERLWATPVAPPEKLRAAATLCRTIQKTFEAKQVFPYGLRFEGTTFSNDGSLKLSERAVGLSCATLILAVLNASGVELVEEASWPVRKAEDLGFLVRVADFADSKIVARLKTEIDAGVRRIQPHEVLGACSCPKVPASFEETKPHAARIAARLDAYHQQNQTNGPSVSAQAGTKEEA